jgi:hypothetical protein
VKGLGEEALAEEIIRRTPQAEQPRVDHVFLSPECGFPTQLMSGWKIGDVFVRHRMPRVQAAFDSRVDGWRLVHEMMRPRNISGGDLWPEWCITTACPHALKAIPWAMVNPKPGKDADIVDEGDSPLPDVLDGLRYGVVSYQCPEPRSVQEMQRRIPAAIPDSLQFIADHLFDQKEPEPSDTGRLAGKRWKGYRRHGRC